MLFAMLQQKKIYREFQPRNKNSTVPLPCFKSIWPTLTSADHKRVKPAATPWPISLASASDSITGYGPSGRACSHDTSMMTTHFSHIDFPAAAPGDAWQHLSTVAALSDTLQHRTSWHLAKRVENVHCSRTWTSSYIPSLSRLQSKSYWSTITGWF